MSSKADRDAVMAPFRMLARAVLRNKDAGASVDITQLTGAGGTAQAQDDSVHALLRHIREHLPEGWSLYNQGNQACSLPDPEPENTTPESYHTRLDGCVERMRTAGVAYPDAVYSTPAGWLRVMEAACDALAARMAQEEGSELRIQDVKEKFGELRFYVYSSGSDAFITDVHTITDWAEMATEGRCAVTGNPGEKAGPGWVLTLSPEMRALRAVDAGALSDLMYPKRPEPDAGLGM